MSGNYYVIWYSSTRPTDNVNSTPSGQNGRHFADDFFKYIIVNDKNFIFIQMSLKYAPKGPTDDNPALV